jgi:hypothetical protein
MQLMVTLLNEYDSEIQSGFTAAEIYVCDVLGVVIHD